MSTSMIGRYPGARPFADDPNDQRLFYGRGEEINMLFHRVCAARLLVLFGKSGLGKTSLLQAGVYPKLRGRHMLPIPVRLNIPKSPLAIIKASIEEANQNLGIDYTPGVGETLWEFFKTAMFWQGEFLLTPILVFDQFEEIFTLKNTEERAALARELGDLFRGTPPPNVRQKLQSSVTTDKKPSSTNNPQVDQPPNIHVILSLREDFLGALQELAGDIPGIFDDRVRLSPLSNSQAEQAICEPASLKQDAVEGQFTTPPFAYDDDALAEILAYLRGKSDIIEPFQLQLVCRDIEEQVAQQQAKGKPITLITAKELGGKKRLDKIVQNFYQQTLAKLPWRDSRYARRLCEEGLLNAEGFRLPLQENEILKTYKLSQLALSTLVESRLLRKEPRLESFFYELSHDSLAKPILDARPWKLTRKQRNFGFGGILVLIALIIFAIWQLQAIRRAEQAREAAEEVLNYLVFDLRDKLKPIGKLDIVEDVQKRVNAYYEKMGIEGQSATTLNRRGAAYSSEGDRLFDQGELEKALEAYQQYSDMVKKAATLELDETTYQSNLSRSLGSIGDVLIAQGKQDEALQRYQDSLKIAQKIAAQNPSNNGWQRDLSASLNQVGNVLVKQGKQDEALQRYQDSLAIRQKLAAQDPSNSGWQRDVSVSLNKLGDILVAQGKQDQALQRYQDSLTIMQKLAAQEPSNTEWQRDVSVSLERIGGVLVALGKQDEALQHYQDSLKIMQTLAAQDPSNTEWQRDLSISYEKIAKIYLKQKKDSEALELYQKVLNIRERLANHDPSNATWQTDVTSVYGQILSLLYELKRYGEAADIAQRRVAHTLKQADTKANKQALAEAYLELAWYELFNKKPNNAIEASEKGLKLGVDDTTNAMLNTNLAHGYLILNQYEKAKAIYLNNKDKKVSDGRSFKQAVLDDFKEFRKLGINHPDMKRIEKLLQ
jgi:tetratricopeptide (TPR) repeat protein